MRDEATDTSAGDGLAAQAAWVRRLARALVRDVDLADDVAGDVLLAAVRARELPVGVGRLRGWLRAVTRNIAGNRTAREGLRRGVEREGARSGESSEPVQDLERLRVVRVLTDALEELAEPYRSTLVLRFFDDLPPR